MLKTNPTKLNLPLNFKLENWVYVSATTKNVHWQGLI